MCSGEGEQIWIGGKVWAKLAHGLQIPTIDSFLTIVFKVGLQSYLKIVIT
jgi:hypothetical protein